MREKYKKIILAAIVAVLAIAGIIYYNKIQVDKKNINSAFIMEKDVNLTPEVRKAVEERLAQAQSKLNNPPKDVPVIEKFAWNMQAGFQELILGKFLLAKEYFLAASALQPNDYNPYFSLYQVYMQMTDYNSARESIKKAITLDQTNTEFWKLYIQLEKEKFNFSADKMKQVFTQALKSTDENIMIVTVYAQYLEEVGELKGAIEQWEKAIIVYPEDKETYKKEIERLGGIEK